MKNYPFCQSPIFPNSQIPNLPNSQIPIFPSSEFSSLQKFIICLIPTHNKNRFKNTDYDLTRLWALCGWYMFAYG